MSSYLSEMSRVRGDDFDRFASMYEHEAYNMHEHTKIAQVLRAHQHRRLSRIAVPGLLLYAVAVATIDRFPVVSALCFAGLLCCWLWWRFKR